MIYFRRSGGHIVLLVLALIGVAISIYLTVVHYDAGVLVCSSSGLVNCERVLSSSYSVVPGTAIPISVPGLLWFIVSAVLAAIACFGRVEQRPVRVAEVAWCALGMLTIFYLVYVEIVRLHAICLWCTSLHVIIFIMLLVSIFLLQETAPADDFDADVENEQPLPSRRA